MLEMSQSDDVSIQKRFSTYLVIYHLEFDFESFCLNQNHRKYWLICVDDEREL